MSTPLENAPLTELMRTLADDARELVRAEVGLVREEFGKSLRALLLVVAGATAAVVVAVLALCVLVASAVLGAGGSTVAALLAAAGWAALLVIAALFVSARVLAKQQVGRAAEPAHSIPHSEVLR